jgi:hypothetical protein
MLQHGRETARSRVRKTELHGQDERCLVGACGQMHGGRGQAVIGWVGCLDRWVQVMDP